MLGLWQKTLKRENFTPCRYRFRSLSAKVLSASNFTLAFSEKKEKGGLGVVYLRFLSTNATAIIATMMRAAAPAISNVSVEVPVPGVGATVGEGITVAVGATVGATVLVGATVSVGAGDTAEPTEMYVES